MSLRYYSNKAFREADIRLRTAYLLESPYRVCSAYQRSIGEDPFTYGETPLKTLEFIANKAGWTSKDTIYEIGCGRGRGCLWLHHCLGAKVIGIDRVPRFIETANRFANDRLQFIEADFLDVDYSDATAIYLYGSCLDEPVIEALSEKLKGSVVSVSYPVGKPIQEFTAPYPWGRAQVFVGVSD